jgi:hypothetical protein
MKAVAGRIAVPARAWSASQGCVCSEMRPVKRCSFSLAREIEAPRKGCSAAARPAAARSPGPLAGSSQ